MPDSWRAGRSAISVAARLLRARSTGFTVGSGAGLAVDLGGFLLLTVAGVPAFAANLTSTALAITTVYLLVTRFAFRVAPTWRTYVAFVLWYAASALAVSAVVTAVSAGDDVVAVIAKICTVPVTFVTNFLFGRWLFGGGAERLATRVGGAWRRGIRPERTVLALLARPAARRRRLVVAVGVTLAFVLLVLPLNLGVSFQTPPNRRGELLAHLLQIAFALALAGAVYALLRLGQAVRLGSVRHRRLVAVAVAYLAINLVVLRLVYPGYWVWDEYYVLDAAKAYSIDAWQGYLTTIFFTAGLFLGPTPVAIVLLQLVVISLIVGYCVSLLMARLARPAFAWLLVVPLLSFPVLLNNQYPLRLTLYGYLLVLLLVRLPMLRSAGAPRLGGFVGVAALIGVLAFWRSEGLPLLLLLPVAFVLAGLHRALGSARWRTIGASLAGVALVTTSGWLTISTAAPAYQLTAIMNPLSTMLQTDLASPNLDRDLRTIDGAIDLDTLEKWPAWVETPGLWNGAIRPGFDKHMQGVLPAFADLVVHNPGPFLDNRVRAFLAANSMQQDWRPQVQNMGPYEASDQVAAQREHFGSTNFLARPIDADLRNLVERRLLLWTSDQRMIPVGQLIWNALPPLALTLLLGLVTALRRRWWWTLAATVILANASVVFLTEPASYFMYFFPAYLAAIGLVSAAAVLAVDAALARRAAEARTPSAVPLATARPSVLLAVPAYNCGPQIARVLDAIDDDLLARVDAVVVIDNRSTDDTAARAEAAGARLGGKFQVWRNVENFGLGGTHKVAFSHALDAGYDYVAIVHGDDQADVRELGALIDRAIAHRPAAVLGARFVRGSRRIGYSKVRVAGNVAINVLYSIVSLRRTVDLGSGINLFATAHLQDRRFLGFDDSITFNIDLLLDYFRRRSALVYLPISWREEDQVSNARNVTVGKRALAKLLRWRLGRPAPRTTRAAYGFEVVA